MLDYCFISYLGKYNILSATTKPTVKNSPLAGRKGNVSKQSPTIKVHQWLSCSNPNRFFAVTIVTKAVLANKAASSEKKASVTRFLVSPNDVTRGMALVCQSWQRTVGDTSNRPLNATMKARLNTLWHTMKNKYCENYCHNMVNRNPLFKVSAIKQQCPSPPSLTSLRGKRQKQLDYLPQQRRDIENLVTTVANKPARSPAQCIILYVAFVIYRNLWEACVAFFYETRSRL